MVVTGGLAGGGGMFVHLERLGQAGGGEEIIIMMEKILLSRLPMQNCEQYYRCYLVLSVRVW